MEEISLEETEGVALETEGVSLESEVHESSWGEVVESDFLTADMHVAEESEVDVTVEKQRNMMVMIVASDQGTSGETDVVEEESLDPGWWRWRGNCIEEAKFVISVCTTRWWKDCS